MLAYAVNGSIKIKMKLRTVVASREGTQLPDKVKKRHIFPWMYLLILSNLHVLSVLKQQQVKYFKIKMYKIVNKSNIEY